MPRSTRVRTHESQYPKNNRISGAKNMANLPKMVPYTGSYRLPANASGAHPDHLGDTTLPKTIDTDGSGSGSGSGGGGGGRRGVRGVEMFRPEEFKGKGYRTAAQLQVDAAIAEKIRQNNVARGVANADFKNAIMELQRVRDNNSLQATKAGSQDMGRLNNMSLNRGMGYGAGALSSTTSLMNKYADIQGGIRGQFAADYGKQRYDYNRELGGFNEADRVVRNSRAAEIDALYRQLYGEAWDRYMAKQNLNLSAVNQRNQGRAMSQGA